jgi:hypothetical protein
MRIDMTRVYVWRSGRGSGISSAKLRLGWGGREATCARTPQVTARRYRIAPTAGEEIAADVLPSGLRTPRAEPVA